MQLQRVPGEPVEPGEAAGAALFARGVILISGRLTSDVVERVTAQVLTSDSGKPLEIHVTNVTGSLRKALLLHDVIAGAEPPPHITAAGGLDAAGAIVLAAGRRGGRSLLPNTTVHLSKIDGAAIADDDGDLAHLRPDLESAAAEAAITTSAEEILGVRLDRPRLLHADEALAEGLADEISLKRK